MRGMKLAVVLLAAALGWGGKAHAQTPLFASDAPLALTIRGPMSGLVSNRDHGGRPATLTVAGGETLPITLSPRGITRRAKDICSFPPLRVEFTGRPPAASLFAGQHRLKLVTHCRPGEAFQQYPLLEYAAYRLYNRLTPFSFRVRLATIDYVDEDGKPYAKRVGFFIEDLDEIAARTGHARARTGDRIASGSLSAKDAARFAVFNFAISNLDWAMSAGPAGEGCCHNARLLESSAGLLPIPYDFDFSGFVDAPYATPPEAVPVANVRVRRYRGYCRTNPDAAAIAADLVGRRAELLETLAATPGLDPRARDKAGKFLSASLDQLAKPAEAFKTCL